MLHLFLSITNIANLANVELFMLFWSQKEHSYSPIITLSNVKVIQEIYSPPFSFFQTGDLVYITVRVGGYWEGVCGQRRGKFKFINVRVLSPEEEEKQKESMEMDICDNDDGSEMTPSEFMPKLSSLKELLERIECQVFVVFIIKGIKVSHTVFITG